MTVKPKKHLGQHFLADENIARKIVNAIAPGDFKLFEIGPGTGVLTKYLIKEHDRFNAIEIDAESVEYLQTNYPELRDRIISQDFLKLNFKEYADADNAIIGNFPYNISSQIFFKVLENKNIISQVVCMIQKEVADRIAAGHGSKTYGILSVLLQSFFDIKYLFTVSNTVFVPPPKVQSAVIKLVRKKEQPEITDEKLFFSLVKTSFNQRRKTMRNSLKSFGVGEIDPEIGALRPEQMSYERFVYLSNKVSEHQNK